MAGGTVTALAVLDAQSDELATIGAVRVGREPSGIAVSSDGNRGYVLNDGDRTMSVVDLRRLAEVDVVETGPAAGLAFVPGRDRVLVTNPDRRAVSVISTPFDEPTVVNADTATVDEDSAVNIAVMANDTSRTGTAILTPRVVAAPLNGTATVSVDRTITYIPNADFNGQDTFTYTSDDGTNFSNVAIVTVTVAAVNDTPTATDDTATTGEDNSVTIDVLGNDVDVESSALAPTLVSAPTNGTATVNFDGTITYQPNADFDGVDSFTYAVSDGALSDLAVVSVSVTPAIAIRLTWDADPRDLDAHLLGPSATGDGPGFHVFYSTPSYNVDGTTGGTAERAAFLVGDDTDGFGPEVTEINRRTPGEYLYYVERFAGEAPLADSNASVTVEDPSTGVARTFSVNPESSGEFWSVFRLTVSPTGEVTITPVDEYGNTEPMLAATAAEAL